MTISESDRLHSQLSRFEGMFPGYRTEIVEGNIVMSAVKPHHAETIRLVWNALAAQVSQEWGFTSDVAFPFDDDHEFCPDLAIIPKVEVAENRSAYSPDLIELVVEVVSPSSVRHDYQVKDRVYAARGIANYLIFDPYKAHCMMLWNPGSEGYIGRDAVPYGKTLVVDTGIGRLKVDTSALPIDRKRT